MRAIETALLATLLTIAAGPVGAQPTGRNELTVFGGLSLVTLTSSTTIDPIILQNNQPLTPVIFPPVIIERTRTFDGGGEFGVQYGRDLTSALTVTGDFSMVPGHELTDETSVGCPESRFCIAAPGIRLIAPDIRFSQRVSAYHYGGGLRLNLLRSRFRSGTLTPSVIAGLGGVTFATADANETALAFRAGGSLSVALRSVTAGFEIVDVIVSDHFVTGGAEHDVRFRITFGVRW